jgi:hypothetical protein
VLNELGLT